MRKFLHSMTTVTAILSIAAPFPVYAEGETADLPVCGADIPMPCAMDDGSVMTEERAAAEAQAAEAEAQAAAAAAAQAEAEAQAAAAAQAEADAAAAAQAAVEAQAAADAQAQADAAAKAAVDAQAAADAAAAADAEAAAQAEAAAAADAAAKAEAEAQAAAQAEADAAKAAADAAAAESQTEAEAAAQAEADAAAQVQADADAKSQADADAATAAAAAATQESSDAATVAKDAAAASSENANASKDAAATEAAAQAADEATATETPAAEATEGEAAEVTPEVATEAPAEEPAPEEAPATEETPATDEAPATDETPAAEVATEAEVEATAETPVDNAPAEIVIDDPEVAAELKALQDEQLAETPVVEVAPDIAAALSEVAQMPVCAEGVAYPCLADDGTMMTEELAAVQAEAEAKAAEEAAAIAEQVASEPPPVVVENTAPTEDAGMTEEAAAVEVANEESVSAEVPVAVAAAATTEGSDAPPADMKVMATEVVSAENVRRSTEEFAKVTKEDTGKKHRLTSLEKVLLIGLGAIVIGKILKNGDRVVDNSGDRVTVQRPDGTYYVMRDDDALMRQDGNVVQTQTFDDGSTISIITKPNGEKVQTIRDASGRVLRRTRILPDGRQFLLFDDTVVVDRIDVTELPRESAGTVTLSSADGDALGSALQDALNDEISRRYSLSQVRNIRAVRELTPVLDIEQITFDTGAAAIAPEEAKKLARLGLAIQKALKKNPGAVFLIEGHTDATGSATLNLRLSDRRAESLALALTEYFNVPPENLVVQGYGEAYLKIATTANERLNRRVAVRDITKLLGADEIALR